MIKKIGILTVVVLIIIASYFIFFNKKNPYIFASVETKSISEVVSESGSIVSNGSIRIYSPTNGIVDKLIVSNGVLVKEKQILFTVKSTATSQEKSEAYAAYQSAKSSLAQAENNRRNTDAIVNRVHDDVKNHDDNETHLQRETRTTAEVAHDNAYSALLAAQANFTAAQAKYNSMLNATVTAPISGIITNLAVQQGNTVNASGLTLQSYPVLIISGISPAEVQIAVGEEDIAKIQLGQSVEIKLNAIENQVFNGQVQRYDTQATLVQSVPKFNAYITINEPSDSIKAGMTADAEIITKKLDSVLVVPNASVKPYQKGRAIRVLNSKGEMIYQPVKTGIRGKEFTQILEGLKQGQQIIVSLSNEKKSKSGLFQL